LNKGALSAFLASWPSIGTRDRNSRRQLRLQDERGPQDAPLNKLLIVVVKSGIKNPQWVKCLGVENSADRLGILNTRRRGERWVSATKRTRRLCVSNFYKKLKMPLCVVLLTWRVLFKSIVKNTSSHDKITRKKLEGKT